MKAKKSAGRASGKDTENVTIDLGETIEKKLRAAGLRTEVGRPASKTGNVKGGPVKGGQPGTFGGYRPGMFGGYRPWYQRFGRPGLGAEATERKFTLIPAAIAQVKTTELLTGLGLGIVGNRALIRLTPALWDNDSKLLHEGLAFVAGLVPMLFKRNATTVGVAVPGAVYLGGTLVDKLFDAVGLPAAKQLRGIQAPARPDAALAARQKLAAIQNRINLAGQQGQQARPQAAPQRTQVPRVVAQAQ